MIKPKFIPSRELSAQERRFSQQSNAEAFDERFKLTQKVHAASFNQVAIIPEELINLIRLFEYDITSKNEIIIINVFNNVTNGLNKLVSTKKLLKDHSPDKAFKIIRQCIYVCILKEIM